MSTYISSKSLSVQLSTSNLESQLLLPSVQPIYQLKSNDTSLLYRYDSDIIDLSSSTSSDISPASIRSVPSLPSSLAYADDNVCSALENSLDFSNDGSNLSFRNCSSNYAWIHSTPRVIRFTFPTVLLANLRGGLCTKLDELSVLLCNNCVDIAVLTETWLHEGITDDLIDIAGRSSRRRGGCLCKTRPPLHSSASAQ